MPAEDEILSQCVRRLTLCCPSDCSIQTADAPAAIAGGRTNIQKTRFPDLILLDVHLVIRSGWYFLEPKAGEVQKQQFPLKMYLDWYKIASFLRCLSISGIYHKRSVVTLTKCIGVYYKVYWCVFFGVYPVYTSSKLCLESET